MRLIFHFILQFVAMLCTTNEFDQTKFTFIRIFRICVPFFPIRKIWMRSMNGKYCPISKLLYLRLYGWVAIFPHYCTRFENIFDFRSGLLFIVFLLDIVEIMPNGPSQYSSDESVLFPYDSLDYLILISRSLHERLKVYKPSHDFVKYLGLSLLYFLRRLHVCFQSSDCQYRFGFSL